MDSLLFLCHRIPYPPNKGDKIRSHHMLKHLSGRFRIHLGTFIDDPQDQRYIEPLRALCADVLAITISPRRRRISSLTGLLTGRALSLPYYANAEMSRWIADTWRMSAPRSIFAFSSPMAQFVLDPRFSRARRVVDFVDVDSEKWRAYADAKSWPMSAIYAREGRKLFEFEREVAGSFDTCIFVSEHESALFNSLLPAPSPKVTYVKNGVDLEYFTPEFSAPNPYPAGARVLVFTGAMDYWANVDAVTWFADEVLTGLRERVGAAEFWIVGSRPTKAVCALAGRAGVTVTGAVADVRPYLRHAVAAVAPMRIARGIQNKVLEAMAMGKPVLGTRAAFEGLDVVAGIGPLIVDEPAAMIARAAALLNGECGAEFGAVGRGFVSAQHSWGETMGRLAELLVPAE